MSASKTLGVITTIGGISLIGWFVINKNEPQLSASQLTALKNDIENKSIAVAPIAIKTPLKQWQEKYAKLGSLEKAQLNKTQIANMGFTVSSDGAIDYSLNNVGQKLRAEQEYPITNNCKQLDVTLRNIILKIAEEGQKLVSGNPNKIFLEALQKQKIILQNIFTTNQCAIEIENERLDESGLLLTKQSIEVEESLKNNTAVDQNIYIGVGGLLLITGLFFLLKK